MGLFWDHFGTFLRLLTAIYIKNPTTFYDIQCGASSRAKHGGAYLSAVKGSLKDLIAVPGRDEVQEC